MTNVVAATAAASVLAWALWKRQSNHSESTSSNLQRTQHLPLPPGPPRRRVAGNALELPTEYAWLVFHDWAKEYGK
jgi:hypothetical protein